jgi:short-subunit dehydrogenase
MISLEKYGPWALVTGGSESIGKSMAVKLAQGGFNIVLGARKQNALDELAKEIRAASGVQVRTVSVDLAAPDMLERLRSVTDDIEVGFYGNNAGTDGHKLRPFLEKPIEEAMLPIQLNVVSQTILAHHYGMKMAKRRRGGILFIGSLAGCVGLANVATYCGSKAYMQLFGEALWTELRPYNVDVLAYPVGGVSAESRLRFNPINPPGSVWAHPDDLAQHALENIANGPVQVPTYLVDQFNWSRSSPRRLISEARGNSVQRNMPLPADPI